MLCGFEVSGSGDGKQTPVRSLVCNERTHKLRKLFAANYKEEPEFYVRVPGRVNLIGEHIDYCGYGVCPMALEQDILLAVGPNSEHLLRLTNQEPQYEDYNCDIGNFKIDVEMDGPLWYKYFLCGVRGIADVLPACADLRGMNVAVAGNIPQSAGLSSSSAMVSAAALATAHHHQLSISKEQLANLSAECERYIGTQGGGMDQAIAFLATEGCAKLIEFCPLRSRDVVLPPGAVFVIAHSLVRLNKAATADFNCRVIECRLASQILAKKNGLSWKELAKLADLQKVLGNDLPHMCAMVQERLHPEPYSKEEVCKELNVSPQELDVVSLTPNTTHIQQFKLYQRALHVFEEALRVRQFHAECERATGECALRQLGELMLASHRSLKDMYECSHPQLDKLVELSRDLTYGMRLTGAGWGGCAVALVSPNNVDKFIETIKVKFYEAQGIHEQLDTLVFATSPKAGASIHHHSVNGNAAN